jgi:hypothetical protein
MSICEKGTKLTRWIYSRNVPMINETKHGPGEEPLNVKGSTAEKDLRQNITQRPAH